MWWINDYIRKWFDRFIPLKLMVKRKRKFDWLSSRIKSTRAVRERKPLIDSRMLPRSLIWKLKVKK